MCDDHADIAVGKGSTSKILFSYWFTFLPILIIPMIVALFYTIKGSGLYLVLIFTVRGMICGMIFSLLLQIVRIIMIGDKQSRRQAFKVCLLSLVVMCAIIMATMLLMTYCMRWVFVAFVEIILDI